MILFDFKAENVEQIFCNTTSQQNFEEAESTVLSTLRQNKLLNETWKTEIKDAKSDSAMYATTRSSTNIVFPINKL